MKRIWLLSLVTLGCGARTEMATIDPALEATALCAGAPPTCVEEAPDCAAPRVVAAACENERWSCPRGARVHERVEPGACLPFHDDVRALGGSLVRVPTDDGRCVWIAGDVVTKDGAHESNVALETAAAPFGSCPAHARAMRTGVVRGAGDLVVQITGGYRLAGRARITYRLFREDPGAPFGLVELGTGLARWDGDAIAIDPAPRFGADLDLGDASIVIGDRAYVYGCPPPIDFLTERCVVGRLDAKDEMELFVGSGKWVASTRGSDGEPVFEAGPWVSSVTARGAGLLHVYAVGFGSDLQTHGATKPEGPWTKGPSLGRCELPRSDANAFCAGPVVHPELADPTRPDEIVVSYGVGTTSDRPLSPDDGWTRLVWRRAP